ncbi:uncharacterized protein BJ171DRAFT_640914 [Polychytrium aggregatum]|uniref:uncharacterized protein n=1 Tax=Polychytrium aggregatum TaxID=110093 RepID=UPI0022FDCA7F|nr:uncharacterized protein BJ171DRAFT_640914 [Polychytrium aggregatum]KAI9193234.1 hypothetical protein BJ171DRAFT_640914 [Polychytrium aggregatum]
MLPMQASLLALALSATAAALPAAKLRIRQDSPRPNGIQYLDGAPGASNLATTTTTRLIYGSGPIVPNVNVHPIYYGSNVNYQSQLNTFYSAIVGSSYLAWLSEYDTPSQNIGTGTFSSSIVKSIGPNTTIDNSAIQTWLHGLVASGTLVPTQNTYYPIHFPPGYTITAGGEQSCVVFCAFHSAVYIGDIPGTQIYYLTYGVMPDLSTSGCAGGCGSDPSTLNNLQSVSSHELFETITDPIFNGWTDGNGNEIGDLCNHIHATITGTDGNNYIVQKQWSNAHQGCYAPPLSSPSSSILHYYHHSHHHSDNHQILHYYHHSHHHSDEHPHEHCYKRSLFFILRHKLCFLYQPCFLVLHHILCLLFPPRFFLLHHILCFLYPPRFLYYFLCPLFPPRFLVLHHILCLLFPPRFFLLHHILYLLFPPRFLVYYFLCVLFPPRFLVLHHILCLLFPPRFFLVYYFLGFLYPRFFLYYFLCPLFPPCFLVLHHILGFLYPRFFLFVFSLVDCLLYFSLSFLVCVRFCLCLGLRFKIHHHHYHGFFDIPIFDSPVHPHVRHCLAYFCHIHSLHPNFDSPAHRHHHRYNYLHPHRYLYRYSHRPATITASTPLVAPTANF